MLLIITSFAKKIRSLAHTRIFREPFFALEREEYFSDCSIRRVCGDFFSARRTAGEAS
jgi:hypothetical protein